MTRRVCSRKEASGDSYGLLGGPGGGGVRLAKLLVTASTADDAGWIRRTRG